MKRITSVMIGYLGTKRTDQRATDIFMRRSNFDSTDQGLKISHLHIHIFRLPRLKDQPGLWPTAHKVHLLWLGKRIGEHVEFLKTNLHIPSIGVIGRSVVIFLFACRFYRRTTTNEQVLELSHS